MGVSSSQIENGFPVLMTENGMVWNNRRGWAVPRHIVERIMSDLFAFYCTTEVQSQDVHSSYYIVHATGECKSMMENHTSPLLFFWRKY